MQVTYILENKNAKTKRRYYVGRTNSIRRRLKEHQKDAYKNYRLIYLFYSKAQVERELKKFGVTRFLELNEMDKFEILNAFVFIKSKKMRAKISEHGLLVISHEGKMWVGEESISTICDWREVWFFMEKN